MSWVPCCHPEIGDDMLCIVVLIVSDGELNHANLCGLMEYCNIAQIRKVCRHIKTLLHHKSKNVYISTRYYRYV